MHDLRTRFVHAKVHPRVVGKPELDGGPSLGRDKQQQKASASGPK
jgi:hypothetical protein